MMADHLTARSYGAGAWFRRPAPSSAAVLGTILLLTAAGAALGGLRSPVAHGMNHLSVALPVALLAYAAWRLWPPPRETAPGRIGRHLLVVGFAAFAVGGFIETLDARVDQVGAAPWEPTAHAVGQVVAMLGPWWWSWALALR